MQGKHAHCRYPKAHRPRLSTFETKVKFDGFFDGESEIRLDEGILGCEWKQDQGVSCFQTIFPE
jgi:hypothetical protein